MNKPDTARQLEQAAYDNWYANNAEFSSREVREYLLAESEARYRDLLAKYASGARVLEIGCGAGEMAVLAAESGANVVAIDISSEAIKRASARVAAAGVINRVRLEQGDIEQIVLEDESFDLVLNHEVFSSINYQTVLPTLARALRPGGKLLGLECLGHNPIFNLNRRIGVWRGRRTAWAASHIFRQEDLRFARRYFRGCRIEYYHLFVFLAVPAKILLGERRTLPLLKLFRSLDRRIVHKPFAGKWAFKAVFELEK